MKLRVLISLLFIIATTFASVHETEHVFTDHNSHECEICTVSQNLLSDDVDFSSNTLTLVLLNEKILKTETLYKHKAIITKYSNAPPKIS